MVIFEYLSPWNFLLALICLRFAEVRFLALRGALNSPKGLAFAEGMGCRLLRVEDGDDRVIASEGHHNVEGDDQLLVLLGWREEEIERLCSSFPGVKDLGMKLRLALKSSLGATADTLFLLHNWATQWRERGYSVCVYTPSLYWKEVCVARNHRYRNLHVWLFQVLTFFGKAFRGLRRATAILRRKKRPAASAGKPQAARAATKDPKSCLAAMFPHEGVEYGNLFLKDHYYSPDPKSPFHMTSILHVEMESVMRFPEASRRRIESFYEERAIPWVYCRKSLTAKDTLALMVFGWRAFRTLSPGVGLVRRCKMTAMLCVVWALFAMFRNFLVGYPNMKVALVGYDFLFPNALSMALQSLGVHIAAVQERYGQGKYRAFHFIGDTFFVTSPYWVEDALRSTTFKVERAVAVGEYRADTLFQFMSQGLPPEFQALKDQGKTLVLALDYHAQRTSLDDARCPFSNWSSNRQFYRHIIRLAVERPDLHLVIRGKNATWLTLPVFEDLAAVVRDLPNVWVNDDYSRYNVSYELAAWADIVIGRYTSMHDEILLAGKPVVIMDYVSNGLHGHWQTLDDRMGLPIFAMNYDELRSRIDSLMDSTDPLLQPENVEVRKVVYGTLFDGKTKDRIRAELEKIAVAASEKSAPRAR